MPQVVPKTPSWDFALGLFGASVALVALAASVFYSGRVFDALDRLQNDHSAATVTSVIQGFDQNAGHLAEYATGYAMWDDTYRFMEDRNQGYLTTNYAEPVLALSPVQLVAFYDLEGKLIFASALDEDGRAVPPSGLLTSLPEFPAVRSLRKIGESVRRIEWMGDRGWLVAICPVSDSSGKAPFRGYLLFGQILGPRMLDRLEALTGVPLRVRAAAPVGDDAQFRSTTHLGPVALVLPDTRRLDAPARAEAIFPAVHSGEPPVGVVMSLPSGALETGRQLSGSIRTAFLVASAAFAVFVGLSVREMIRGARTQRQLRAAWEEAERLAEKAGAADRAKGAFLAMMSHEIRTPLNAIIGYADLLRDNPTEALTERLGIISNNGGILQHLLDDVLDFSKIEAGKLEIAPRPTALRTLIRETLATYRNQADIRRNTLCDRVGADVPEYLLLDDRRVTQVLGNLVANAVKFTSHGTIVVSAEREGPSAPAEPGAAYSLRLAVKDDGIGIAADKADSLFEPFTQVDSSKSRRYEGSGLGLAICRRLCTLMGGTIAHEGQSEGGSVFVVRLPTVVAAPPEDVPAARPPGGADFPREILVVDDNLVNARLLGAILRRLGREARLASSGEEALEIFSQRRFDLVFLDIHMPGMDGRETAARLREIERRDHRPRCAMIAVTADILADSADGDLDGRLRKPVRVSQIEAVLCGLADARPS